MRGIKDLIAKLEPFRGRKYYIKLKMAVYDPIWNELSEDERIANMDDLKSERIIEYPLDVYLRKISETKTVTKTTATGKKIKVSVFIDPALNDYQMIEEPFKKEFGKLDPQFINKEITPYDAMNKMAEAITKMTNITEMKGAKKKTGVLAAEENTQPLK